MVAILVPTPTGSVDAGIGRMVTDDGFFHTTDANNVVDDRKAAEAAAATIAVEGDVVVSDVVVAFRAKFHTCTAAEANTDEDDESWCV